MKLAVYASFEPALLQRVLSHWNERVPLFTAVEVSAPSRLEWGLRSDLSDGELRVFAFDAAGLEQAGARQQAEAKGDLIDALAEARAAGVQQILDPESERAAGVPYTDAFYLALGTAIFRRARGRVAPEIKAIAVDCDGTLWQGLCAEDGPDGVSIGPEELALHAYLLAQKQAGRILVLVSKNVPADVEAVFERRRDLGISLSDVAAVRAGWESKAVALQRLSRELKLSTASFLFIDDSPAECAEVSAALPEVAVLQRPSEDVRSFLQAAWPLDLKATHHPGLGEARTRLYQDEERRNAVKSAAPSFAEYVQSLEVRVELSPATAADEGRVFELTQRTNQFNTRGDRPSAESVHQAIASKTVLVARVADRFGDYGLCGVIFEAPAGETLRIDRLLLSCRVLGRGVEEEIFDLLVARASGFKLLAIAISNTPRNQPARGFLERLGNWSGVYQDETYRFTIANLSRAPREVAPSLEQPELKAAAAIDWNAVAALTLNPSALAAELGLTLEGPAGGDGVLAVASEVLGCPVAPGDNLYALGADSLRLVRIVARLRSKLGIEVPIAELLYRGDVSDLLALASRGAREPEEDPSFLSQLDSLYDDDQDEPLA